MLNAWIMRIAVMAAICSLIEFLVPQGKLKKTVIFAIGLVFTLFLASPVVELLGG